jgi:signal transduction histidine kinase
VNTDKATQINDLCKRVAQRPQPEMTVLEEALRLAEYRLESLLELSQMSWASVKEIADYILERQVCLTRSKLGAISLLNEDETALTFQAWSKEIRQNASMGQGTDLLVPIESTGLWAEAVRERKPLIVNDFSESSLRGKVFPDCPVEISRFMSVPVFDGARIMAIALVGNIEEEYDDSDLNQLTLLMDGMWKLIQRRQSDKALRESESLAAIGKALSGLAHDLRTPIVAIGGFTRLIQKHMGKDNPDWNRLEIVLKETQRMETMVINMLDFARPLELDRSRVDIERVIGESLAVVESAAREKMVQIRRLSSPNLPFISVDAMRMKQVIIDLVMNAVQASPEGETVVVHSHYKGENLALDIIDYGSGIPPEKREEIFYPFVSSKKEGTGLGLAIVRKIIEAHKGQVRIFDNPKKGVTFSVLIPQS